MSADPAWAELPYAGKVALVQRLADQVTARRRALWHPYPWQIPPGDIPAHGTWLQMGGRGVGKTDGAARYVTDHVRGPACDPRLPGGHRIAIVAPTLGDAVESCVYGPSGLRAHDPSVTLRQGAGGIHVRWPTGAEAKLFGAHTPDDVERLRSGGNRCVAHGTLVATADGHRPIESIRPGDLVWTRNGLRTVLHAGQTDVREVWRLSAGPWSVDLTSDHKVWTETRGWVPAGLLTPSDTVMTWNNGPIRSTAPVSSHGTGTGGGYTKTVTTGTPTGDCSTGPSTRSPMAESLTERKSTTGTTTNSTITRTTSSLKPRRNTGPNTTTSAAPTGTPWAGTPVHGIAETSSTPAPFAGGRSSAGQPGPMFSSAGRYAVSVTTRPLEPAAHIRNGFAWCAANLSAPAPVARPRLVPAVVRQCLPTGTVVPVYDLTVADDHEFIAGGILIHNCVCWLEEIAAMRQLGPALDHTAFGLRIGPRPHYVASTTPKPRPELRRLLANPLTVITRGRTADAIHLDPAVRAELMARYGGTRLGRQELEGEVLDDVEGALWTWDGIDAGRVRQDDVPDLVRIAVAVDPAVSVTETSDEMGLVAGGMGTDGHVYILADRSVKDAGASAARRVWQLWADVGASVVVYESNQGKRWVGDVLSQVWRQMQAEGVLPAGSPPLSEINATLGKRLRADPVAAMYEPPAKVHHVIPVPAASHRDPMQIVTDQLHTRSPVVLPSDAGRFEALEDQMTTWVPESGESPDRLDALVHLVTHLASRASAIRVVTTGDLPRSAFTQGPAMPGLTGTRSLRR